MATVRIKLMEPPLESTFTEQSSESTHLATMPMIPTRSQQKNKEKQKAQANTKNAAQTSNNPVEVEKDLPAQKEDQTKYIFVWAPMNIRKVAEKTKQTELEEDLEEGGGNCSCGHTIIIDFWIKLGNERDLEFKLNGTGCLDFKEPYHSGSIIRSI
jgi:hypothetical protein